MTPFQIMRMRKPVAAGGTDPNFASVKLLCGFEGTNGSTTFVDESSNARTLTAGGNAQISTAQFKFGASSLLLDGTGDYVSAPDSADWDFGTGQFTVEAFIRRAASGTEWTVMSQWSSTSGNAAWALFATTGGLYFRFYDSANVLRDTFAAFSATTGTWYHVAADRDAAGKVRTYVDGVMLASATFAQAVQGSTNPLRIGSIQDFAAFDFNGNLDEVRITKGVARYASGSGFTVPSAAFPRS